MEGNRDEANRCIDIALSSINLGNYGRAEKFLRKAENLYPTQRAKDLLQYVNSMYGSKSQPEDGVRQRKTASDKSGEQPAAQEHLSLEYSKDQLEVVQKVKKCKDYYEVLGVTKESTDSEIKKAYKKLALQLHPDKNRAPGAAEAFKAIGNAVAVLTDPRKRKEYDLFGNQSSSGTNTTRFNHNFHHNRNNYEYAYDRGFESDISAEELFNMFFGGFPQQRRPRFTRHQHEHNQQPSLAFGLILVLIMISILSSFFTSDPLYSLSQNSKYPVHKQTSHLGISYYVKESFAEEYQGSIPRLENSVEEDYVATMKTNCYRERSYKESVKASARTFGNRYQYDQAQALKTPSCDNLARIGNSRFVHY